MQCMCMVDIRRQPPASLALLLADLVVHRRLLHLDLQPSFAHRPVLPRPSPSRRQVHADADQSQLSVPASRSRD